MAPLGMDQCNSVALTVQFAAAVMIPKNWNSFKISR